MMSIEGTRCVHGFQFCLSRCRLPRANATVNYAGATVTVRERGAGTLTVSQIAFDNDGYGLSNNIQWKVAGLKTNTYYDVTIANVVVSGAARSYTYFFRILP